MLVLSELHASRLLRLTDTVIISLDIRNIAKCDCHRISYFIGDSDTVQARRKFTWIRRRDKQDCYRQRHKIFQ